MTLRVKNISGMLHYYQDGVEITAAEARALVAATPDGVVAVNEQALLAKIATALANNAAFLAIASSNQVINPPGKCVAQVGRSRSDGHNRHLEMLGHTIYMERR
jgi:hypothetical protein